MNYSIDTSLEQNEEFSAFLEQKIKEYNNKHSIHHREKRKEGSVQPINIIVLMRASIGLVEFQLKCTGIGWRFTISGSEKNVVVRV